MKVAKFVSGLGMALALVLSLGNPQTVKADREAVSTAQLTEVDHSEVATAVAEPAADDHWELFRTCPNQHNAGLWARFYQSQGYQTDIRAEGGFYNVYAWVAD
jgi:hypothetical protein